MEYYERQTSKDCSVHSFNNALGYRAITPEEVSNEISRRVYAYADVLRMPADSKKVVKYWRKLAHDGTYFCAECVWYAAAALGRATVPQKIRDFDGRILTEDIATRPHLIFLGQLHDGSPHAIGARYGRFYDSLHDGPPLPLTQENMDTIYGKVLGIFCFGNNDGSR